MLKTFLATLDIIKQGAEKIFIFKSHDGRGSSFQAVPQKQWGDFVAFCEEANLDNYLPKPISEDPIEIVKETFSFDGENISFRTKNGKGNKPFVCHKDEWPKFISTIKRMQKELD